MKYFLNTLSFDEAIEVNQYVPLDGIVVDADKVLEEKDKKTIDLCQPLFEAAGQGQTVFVPLFEKRFRDILQERRELSQKCENTAGVIPCSPDGYMALKASQKQSLLCGITGIYNLEQVAFGLANNATWLFIDIRLLNQVIDPWLLINQCKEMDSEAFCTKVILSGIDNANDFRRALLQGPFGICASYNLYKDLLLNSNTMAQISDTNEKWLEKQLELNIKK